MSVPELGITLEVENVGEYEGSLFDDSYELGEEINSGSFGVVYRTCHKDDPDEIYAVKVVDRDCAEAEEEAIRESDMMRDLREVPNVIKIIDFFIEDDAMYIVQLLAAGGDVFDRLAARVTYTEKDARDLCLMLLTTVKNVHEHGIVHRDLKPENLLLRDDTSDANILLCDFGLAARLPKDGTGLMTFCGTPAYTAPEILVGVEYREKVDAWSIGCILYMLLGGCFPFGDQDDPDLYDKIQDGDYVYEDESWDIVSGGAKRLISKLLKVEVEDRWDLEQAVNSNWFTKSKAATLQQSNLQRSLDGIRKFVARRRLKAAMHVVRISQRVNFIKAANANPLGLALKKDQSPEPSESETNDDGDDTQDKLPTPPLRQQTRQGSRQGSKGEKSGSLEIEQDEDEDTSARSEEGDNFAVDDSMLEDKLQRDSCLENKYSLLQVQTGQVKGMDPKRKEDYLCDEDFLKVFKASREEVKQWKEWKLKRAKISAKLF